MLPEELRTTDIIAHFFNKAEGRKEVALNDRFGQVRDKLGDFFCSEYHSLPHEMMMSHPWEEIRCISQSFGYNREDTDENVLAPDELIDMFTRIVSENGNLLLMINLDGTGALPEIQASRLRELGAWLKVNGEAIYGSRPCRVSNQDEGKIRFTQSKDGSAIYVICTDFPKDKLLLHTIHLNENSKVTMLGAGETELKWSQPIVSWAKRALEITIPDDLYAKRRNEHAWVFKLEIKN
jgi:alpha-L-fucosidase